MHSLDANLALPHALEPALLSTLGRTAAALPPPLLTEPLADLVRAEGLASLGVDGTLAVHGARGAEHGAGC